MKSDDPQRRIDAANVRSLELKLRVERLESVVAQLIDAQKYHLRGDIGAAREKNGAAADRYLRMING
jgi:hypothetical protein